MTLQHSQADLDQLRRLEPAVSWQAKMIAHWGEVIAVGPFLALLHRDTDSIWLNYAAPREPLGSDEEVAEGLGELGRIFADRKRVLRIGFNERLFPRLPRLLEEHGFTLQERAPFMICTQSDFRPLSNPDVSVRFLRATDSDSDLAAYQSIVSQVLGDGSWQPTPAAILRFCAEVESADHRRHALAKIGDTPVGTGFISSAGGVSEVHKIATAPACRRRRVATTVTSFMLQDRFDSGDTLAWLTATDTIAQAVYQKLGFRLVGERLYYQPG